MYFLLHSMLVNPFKILDTGPLKWKQNHLLLVHSVKSTIMCVKFWFYYSSYFPPNILSESAEFVKATKPFFFVKGYLWRRCKPSCWGWSCAPETSSAAVWEVLWKKPIASPAWTHPVGQCWLVACEGKQPACHHHAVILQKHQNSNNRIIFVTWNSHVQTLWEWQEPLFRHSAWSCVSATVSSGPNLVAPDWLETVCALNNKMGLIWVFRQSSAAYNCIIHYFHPCTYCMSKKTSADIKPTDLNLFLLFFISWINKYMLIKIFKLRVFLCPIF